MVIVVGNLTVGGTGKTPVVEKLAKSLKKQGRNVAVLSRGYKSKAENLWKKFLRWLTHGEQIPPKIVSDGDKVLLNSEVAGDEPNLLAKNLPGVAVLVDKDRVKAGQYAIRRYNSDTLILDDGFQYFRLQGSFYILLIDATNPFGNGKLLPRGILRESVRNLRRASYVFITKANEVQQKELKELKATVKKWHPTVGILECIHAPQYLQVVNSTEKLSLEKLDGLRVTTLTAIAMPQSFENFLERNGVQIVCKKRFVDHYRFSAEDIEEVIQESLKCNADCIITTEKDAVRLEQETKFPIPFYFLRMEIEIIGNEKNFEKAIHKLSGKLLSSQ